MNSQRREAEFFCPRCYEYGARGSDAEVVCDSCDYRGVPARWTAEEIARAQAWAEEVAKQFGWE